MERIEREPQHAEARSRPQAAAVVLPYLASLALVGVSTALGAIVDPRWGNGPVDLLYVPAVLASAILFGLWPALVASLASALAYNYFFTPPFHTFQMARPADVVTEVVLFLVAIVTSKLAAGVREQAEIARHHAARVSDSRTCARASTHYSPTARAWT